ncbi:hypothetical protein [Phenylobacterium sp.]|uniref:hypothetical protein n=1 Tax=Phenylobacterium sp. TaxID=1871053 RepID=UPI002E31F26F|nr:hypothetical protein [Phenylobacterium sp.]HEX2558898.1 hypothetical protein [Phenylobacterium sp.]
MDFEASSLADDSYPIEVAWVFEDGRSESHLIRPAPPWTDWDPEAAAMHGLTRERLGAEGEPHDLVARRVLETLGPHEAFVSAPSWDGKWLSVLLRAAGLPRHAMRFKPTAEAHAAAVAEAWGREPTPDELEDVVTLARISVATEPVRHRALADADQELRLWREVGRLAASNIPAHPGGRRDRD